MKKSLIFITAILAIAFMSTYAFSWGSGRGMGGPGSGPGMNWDRGVWNDLSKEQRDELNTLRQKFIDDTYELRTEMMLKHNQFRMLMETSTPDRAELTKLSREASDLMNRIQEKRIDFMLSAKKVAPELTFGTGMGRGGSCGGSGKGGKGARGTGACWNQSGNCGRY